MRRLAQLQNGQAKADSPALITAGLSGSYQRPRVSVNSPIARSTMTGTASSIVRTGKNAGINTEFPMAATRASEARARRATSAPLRRSRWAAASSLIPKIKVPADATITGNAPARVIATLHRGEKRLVVADSRRTVEKVTLGLRDLEVETFVSHSSLSVDARRQAETAFSQARNCVIVSTSTLELGIDVGDLDRVVQIGAPRTVAAVLQRLGRTGRRPGTERNMLFLSTDVAQFLRACGLLLLWSEGYVEPVTPPPTPLHVAAQQLLGLTLQERRIGANTWHEWFSGLGLATPVEWQAIAAWLVETGHLDSDQGMLFMGPEAERKYGGVHYRDLNGRVHRGPAGSHSARARGSRLR
jgi:hypothetical protein